MFRNRLFGYNQSKGWERWKGAEIDQLCTWATGYLHSEIFDNLRGEGSDRCVSEEGYSFNYSRSSLAWEYAPDNIKVNNVCIYSDQKQLVSQPNVKQPNLIMVPYTGKE